VQDLGRVQEDLGRVPDLGRVVLAKVEAMHRDHSEVTPLWAVLEAVEADLALGILALSGRISAAKTVI